jgi:hypothetical protein
MPRITKRTYKKTDIVNHLGRHHGFKNYLELCTATTGHCYAQIDRSIFETTRRLMYRCLFSFDDGQPIDFRGVGADIDEAMAACADTGVHVDICLVDGFHSYDETMRDLRTAFALLADGGMLVVHDCLPTTRKMASSTYFNGNWCGLAYKAFLDFVLAEPGLDYCTIDCDYGCGIIVKNRTIAFANDEASPPMPPRDLIEKWQQAGGDYDAIYTQLQRNKKALLRLVSARNFVRHFGLRAA